MSDELMSLQTKLTETEHEMKMRIQQLTTQHEMLIKQLRDEHSAQLQRVRTGNRGSVTITTESSTDGATTCLA